MKISTALFLRRKYFIAALCILTIVRIELAELFYKFKFSFMIGQHHVSYSKLSNISESVSYSKLSNFSESVSSSKLSNLSKPLCTYIANEPINCSIFMSHGAEQHRIAVQQLNQLLRVMRRDVIHGKNTIEVSKQYEPMNRNHSDAKPMLVDEEFGNGKNSGWSNQQMNDVRSISLQFHNASENVSPQSIFNFYEPSMNNKACRQCLKLFAHYGKCQSNPNATIIPQPKDSFSFVDQSGVHVFVIPGGGIVEGSTGIVFTRGYLLISNQCEVSRLKKTVHLQDIILSRITYKEVFVVTQYWGIGFFHNLIENMPRIALYVDFLRANPTVRIHVSSAPNIKQIMKLFLLNPARIVTGNIQARTIYLPQGGGCGGSSCPVCLRVMSDAFSMVPSTLGISRSNSVDLRHEVKPALSSKQTADYLVLVKRGSIHRRYLSQHRAIETILKDMSTMFNLTYVLYSDNPVPTMQRTLDVFRRALLVVAPHGAGLSNLVFAPRGVFVVEVLSKNDTNDCYKKLCYDLGQRWHGILSSTPNPAMTVDLNYLSDVVKLFISNRNV